jgi:hypothetical protein
LKINLIYIERRKQEIQYYESLPSEYAEILKKNNYENIFELVKDKFTCTHRGKIMAKNKGEIDMFFVEGRI